MPDYQVAAEWVIKRLDVALVVHAVTIAETLESVHRACRKASAPLHIPDLFPRVELGLIVIPPLITELTEEESGPVNTEALSAIGKALLVEFEITNNDMVRYPLGEQLSDGQIIVFKPQALPSILTAIGLHLLEVATHD
jgi:hypothetical protein